MFTTPTLALALLAIVALCRAEDTAVSQEAPKLLKPRSAALSGVLEWAIPMAGHVYAGDPVRGIVPNLLRVGGAVIVFQEYMSSDWHNYDPSTVLVGNVLSLGGTIWAIWSAIDTATDRNEAIRQAGLQPVTGWLPDGTPTIGLCYSF